MTDFRCAFFSAGNLFFALIFSLLSFAQNVSATEITVLFQTSSETLRQTFPTEDRNGVEFLTIPRSKVPTGTQQMEVRHPRASARPGEDGFFVFSNGMLGNFQFQPKGPGEYVNRNCVMPMLGVRTPAGTMCVILTGMRYEAVQVARFEGGQYSVFPRFMLENIEPYEDFQIEFHSIPKPDATYADVAKVYRQFQLDRGRIRPIREEAKRRPELKYAADSIEIRFRMAWKPVPSPVPEQNAENEPPVRPVITFDRFKQIVDEFQRQGLTHAELCLVGWNVGGHDGRYPQIFPAEPKLGGDEKLREAVRYAQERGFQVVCHTNYSDAYHASCIGGRWDENYLLVMPDGSHFTRTTWGGGQMFFTCPECMHQRFAAEDFAKLKTFGFRGLHYVDVYSTVNPRTCWSKEHPETKEDFARWTDRIFEDAQKTFGGFASEGGFDYAIQHLDYALYLSFHTPGAKLHPFLKNHVPFWNLVYHGYVLSSPYRATTNFTIKDPKTRLKVFEFCGRPMFYFHSRFKTTNDQSWGDVDLTCGTDAEMREAVAKMKEGFDAYEKLSRLQYETMEGHDEIAENVFRTTFSDGTAIFCNYRPEPFMLPDGQTVPAEDYVLVAP